MRKRQYFQQVIRKARQPHNSKWFKYLYIRYDNIQLLEENIGKIFQDIKHSNISLNQSSKAKDKKGKVNKWDLIKTFCMPNETINKIKKQPAEWQKIFANDATHKRLISKIYKQLIQLNIKKNFTMAEDLNRHFSKENIQMTNRYMK